MNDGHANTDSSVDYFESDGEHEQRDKREKKVVSVVETSRYFFTPDYLRLMAMYSQIHTYLPTLDRLAPSKCGSTRITDSSVDYFEG